MLILRKCITHNISKSKSINNLSIMANLLMEKDMAKESWFIIKDCH